MKEQNPNILELITEIAKGRKIIHLNADMKFSTLNFLFSLRRDFKKEILNKPDKNDSNKAFMAENSYPNTFVRGRVWRKRLITPIINK